MILAFTIHFVANIKNWCQASSVLDLDLYIHKFKSHMNR